MHVAICDDNVADRKQMERLLSRESDRRLSTTGHLFIDSYGNANTLLSNPLEYNVYYIDMCKTEGVTGDLVAKSILEKGIHALIVMCCSDVDYRDLPCPAFLSSEASLPENIIFLDKPIKTAELSETIDRALEYKKLAPSMIELREEEYTHYVEEPEILYCVEDGLRTDFTLTGGRKIQVATSALNFFSQVDNFPVFMAPTDKVVINCRHVAKLGFRKVIMTDGTVFKVHRDCMPYAKLMYAELNGGKS